MKMILFAIQHDWPFLLPIFICSLLAVGVAIERWMFFRGNKRDVVALLDRLQEALDQRALQQAAIAADRTGGLLGQVAKSGVQTLMERASSFDRQFDISASLALRKLERRLAILGTIATISPYLGLFGTVIRILITFGDMAQTGGGASASSIMFGIGSALIATACGLGVAIAAVALHNYFHTQIGRWEDDFQLIKLMLLSAADKGSAGPAPVPMRRPTTQI